MRNLAHMPVKGRVANALLSLRSKFGESKEGYVNINLSRQDLASYIGATYETVFRIMTELEEENAIGMFGKNIFIRNESSLHHYGRI